MKIEKNKIIAGILIIVLAVLVYKAVAPQEQQYDVTLDYFLKINDGTVIDTTLEHIAKEADIYTAGKTYEPLKFRTGTGQVIEAVEIAVKEMEIGDEKIIIAPPEQAYGTYQPDLFNEEVEKVISVDEITTVKKEEYIQIFRQEPQKGQVIQLPNFDWELEVTEVGETTVAFKNLLNVGDTVSLSGTSWQSTVEKIEEGRIFIRQNPQLYNQLIIPVNNVPITFRVVRVKGNTFDIDGNHPLAGETLTFQIYMRDKQPAQ